MQMLRDEGSGLKPATTAALEILAVWKDKKALPQIREIVHEQRCTNRREAIAAYLAIDDG